MANPSNFTGRPWDSVLRNTESEYIAANIMRILKRTGNTFRELTWDEYKTERLKDEGFDECEHRFFNRVIGFCKSEDTARNFCKNWYEELPKDTE
jgi:hypothetical protein